MSARPARILVLVAIATALCAPVTALASQGRVKSAIKVQVLTSFNGQVLLTGKLTSAKPKCVAGRKIVIEANPDAGDPFALDRSRTSRNGGWAGGDELSVLNSQGGVSSITIRAAARSVKLGKNRLLECGAARETVALN